MGLWLYHVIRGERSLADDLPADKADQDAVAVVRALFRLLVSQRFKNRDAEKLATFVRQIHEDWRWQERALPEGELVAAIQEAIEDEREFSKDDYAQAMVSFIAVSKKIVDDYGYPDEFLVSAINSAEQVAGRSGYSPTQIDRSVGTGELLPSPGQRPYQWFMRAVFFVGLILGLAVIVLAIASSALK